MNLNSTAQAAQRDYVMDQDDHVAITDPSDGIGTNVSGDELKSEKEIDYEETDNENPESQARLLPQTGDNFAEVGKTYEFQQIEGATISKVQRAKNQEVLRTVRYLMKKNGQTKNMEDDDSDSDDQENQDEQNFLEFNPEAKNQEYNKAVFREKYGYEINLPCHYILDSKVYPKLKQEYIFLIIKYVVPDSKSYNIKEYREGQPIEEKTFAEAYQDKPGNEYMQEDFMCLKVIKKENNNLTVVDNIPVYVGDNSDNPLDSKEIKTAQITISPNGKHIALLIQDGKNANVMIYNFDKKNVKLSLQEIKKRGDSRPLSFVGKFTIMFGWASQKVILYNYHQVLVIDIADRTLVKDLIDRNLPDHNKIEKILDVKFGLKTNGKFQCLIAAKEIGHKNIIIIDLLGQSENRNMVYVDNEPIVKISIKNDNAAMSNETENYILEYNENRKAYEQKQIDLSFSDARKKVKFIYPIDDDFLFVYHKEHDQRLRIINTQGKKFYFDKNIQPGRFIMHDIIQAEGSKQIVILNSINEEFHYNFINYSKHDTDEELSKNGLKGQILYWDPFIARDITWPYAAFSDFENTILIFNAFDDPNEKYYRRLFLPEGKGEIVAIKITEDFQLFCLVQNTEDYCLLTANLDEFDQGEKDFSNQKIELKTLFIYKRSLVKDEILQDLFIRSANPENYQLLMVMIQHGDTIYFWKQDQQKQIKLKIIQSLVQSLDSGNMIDVVDRMDKIQNIQSQALKKLDANNFIVRQDNENGKFVLLKIQMLPNLFRQSEMYVEEDNINVIEFFYDIEYSMLFIISAAGSESLRFKIINTSKNNEIVANFRVDDQQIIGKILARNYTVIGGFIYFNNRVIKIRYDQIMEKRSDILTSDLAFDKYLNILDLKKGQQVTTSPLVSSQLHRQAYMTRNFEMQKNYKMIIMPFLHERKIYLNKMKKNHEYHYVTLNVDPNVEQTLNDLHKGDFEDQVDQEPSQESQDKEEIFQIANDMKEPAKDDAPVEAQLEAKLPDDDVQPIDIKEVALETVRYEDAQAAVNGKTQNENEQLEGGSKDVANKWASTIKLVKNANRQISEIKRSSTIRKSILRDSMSTKSTNKDLTYFFSVNFSKSEFHVYDWKGKLIKEVSYKNQTLQYGNPISASKNGLLFVFQKPDVPHVFNIMALTLNNFEHFDTIDLMEELKNSTDKIDIEEYFKNADQINYETSINDRMDFMVQVSQAFVTEINDQLYSTFQKDEHGIITKIFQFAHECFEKDKNKEQMWQALKDTLLPQKLTNTSYNILKFMSIKHWQNIAKAVSIKTGSIIYVERYNPNEHHDSILDHNEIDQYQYLRSSITHHKDQIKQKKNKEILIIHSQQIKNNQKTKKRGDPKLVNQDEITREIYDFNNHFQNYKILMNQSNFTMNNNKIFFWNEYQIWYYEIGNLAEGIKASKMPSLNFYVDKSDKTTYIRAVTCGSNSNKILIRVKQSPSLDYIMTWDMINNRELDAFDVPFHAKAIQDINGSFYLIFDGKVIVCNQNVRLQCFEVQNNSFGRFEETGHQFDSKNHNWILQNEYIGLSFSFMTLVIRNHSQMQITRNIDVEHFDPDQYNFVMNHKNFMTCDPELLTTDFEQLEIILKHLQKKHILLLQQLHYYFYEKNKESENIDLTKESQGYVKRSKDYLNSKLINLRKRILREKEINDIDPEVIGGNKVGPLHLAKSNDRSVGIILHFMALVEQNCSKNFQDVLGECIENPFFIEYISNLPFQTYGMVHKQTLRVNEQYNEHIVKVNGSSSSFTDNSFYQLIFKEEPKNENFTSFPVKVTQVNISWLMTDNGKNFLEVIESTENIGIFETQTMILIIEYLYKNFRNKKLKTEFPVFCIQTISYFVVCLAADDSVEKKSATGINFVFSLYTLYVVLRSLIVAPKTYLRSIHSYTEMIYCALILAVSIGTIAGYSYFKNTLNFAGIFSLNHLRVIESILSIIILDRLFYYLQMLDAVSPLITMINVIFQDITWFMVVIGVTLFAFSVSFYLIGLNQLDEGMAVADVPYSTIVGSIEFIYNIIYTQWGNNDFNYILWFYFVLANFIFVIHFLNMLIAIMGNTFDRINEVKEKMTLRQHLTFILTNWSMDPIKNKEQISYLICAFLRTNDANDDEAINEVQDRISELTETVNDKVLPRLFYQQFALKQIRNQLNE